MAKILIIDDRPLNRQFLTTLLGYQHHQLSEASDGAEGLRMAREQRPDLIISDVLMPTMDGYEFVLQLRADPEIGKTPVVFSTAHYLSRESTALAKKCGITSIIFKPCEPQAVLDIVAAALGEQPVPLPPALRQPEEFNRDHLLLVTNKAAEGADELRAAHDKLSALIELSTDLAQERDPVLLLDRICSVAREVIGTRWTMVVLLEPNRKIVQHLGIAGIQLEDSPALRSALLENGVFKTVTQEGRTISLSDVTSTPTALRLPQGLPRAASLLVAPLVMRGHVDGWICLADKLGLDAFTEEDEQLAPALAAQMAVAYANARLYSDSVKYASKLETEISERVKVEGQLSENKARLAGIIDAAMDAIITIDSGQKIVMFNKAAEKMFGCLAAKVIGQPLDRFIPPRFTVSHAQDIRRFGETGVTTRAMGKTPAVNAVRADGEEFPVEASISQIEVGDQKLYTVIMRDITERKLAEEDSLRLAAIVQSSEDAIIGKTLDGIITSWNKGAESLYGYSAEEVVGGSIAILAPSGHSDELTSILDRLRRVESIEQFETERITKEGTRVLVSLTISPIKNSSGQVVGASTIARDIGERKRAEEALRASELRYRRLFESAKDGILILDDASGQIVDVNPFLIEMLGYSKDELLGKELWEMGAFKDIVASREAFEELQQYGYIRYEDLPLKTLDGVTKQVEFVSNTYIAGKVRVIQCNIRDITERKRAEEALRETNQHLKQALEALQEKTNELTATTQQLWQASKLATMGELAASVAHELNNPLATVGLRAENLLMQLPEHSDQRKPLEIIAQEVDRMATLVNNLLQFSRRSHREVSTLDLSEEIATSVEFVHYHLRSHNIEVVREFADGLPTIQADRQQLRQLFLNLLTNASDSMPQGGILTVRATSNGFGDSAVAIEFADTGEGITAENMEKIWEPFFTTKPEGKGTGLGLAICHRIVEEHSGTIDIQSPVGRGTTVHIVLPATSTEALV
ncbi:MAG TPA: PAS domain S-box protein [Pyrinomonadaceae bacterium]|nr:PAS domain S-box protein [Pyrinomonadaceae bacterium]